MKNKKMPTRLFIMKSFMNAYESGYVSGRKRRGVPSPDGWIPNTFWSGWDRAGGEGQREARRVKENHNEYFEICKSEDIIEQYGRYGYRGNAKIEFKRIKPTYRTAWTALTRAHLRRWEDKK